MDKTYNRTWRNKFGTEVSTHLLKYLNMLGITYDEQTNSYYCDGLKLRESYFEENMFVSGGGCEDDWWDCVCLNSSETHFPVGEIYQSGTVVYCGKQSMESKIVRFTEDNGVYQVEYTPGNREKDLPYCLAVSQDSLGNIMIAFGGIDDIWIKIGETVDTASDYLETLKSRIKRKIGKDEMWPMVELLFDDPRIKNKLNEFIQNMATDIDQSFEQKVRALYAQYCTDAVNIMTQLSNKFLTDLRKLESLRDNCKKSEQGCNKKKN